MLFSITPVPFECVPEGACTRRLSLRADRIAAVLLLDFKLLRKRWSALAPSSERLDPYVLDVLSSTASQSGISDRTFMLSESDRDNEVLDRHRPDQKLCSPLPSLALRDNADANAKARYGASLRGLQVSSALLLDLAASVRCRQRTALEPQA